MRALGLRRTYAFGSLTVIGGRWEDSRVGHPIKSRAARTCIENVVLIEGGASRAIDLPNGGDVEILGCAIAQSDATQNSQIVEPYTLNGQTVSG